MKTVPPLHARAGRFFLKKFNAQARPLLTYPMAGEERLQDSPPKLGGVRGGIY